MLIVFREYSTPPLHCKMRLYSYRSETRAAPPQKNILQSSHTCCIIPAVMRNLSATGILLSLLRIGLGLFFLITAVQKLTPDDLGETAEFLTRSDLLPEFFSMPLACIGIMMELTVGICLLFKLDYRGICLWGVIMTGVYFLLFSQAWARGLSLSCNCLGSTHEIENYPMDTGLRLLLLGAMLLLLWDSRRAVNVTRRKARRFDFSDA